MAEIKVEVVTWGRDVKCCTSQGRACLWGTGMGEGVLSSGAAVREAANQGLNREGLKVGQL